MTDVSMAMSPSEMALRAEESVGGDSSEATEPRPGSDQLRLFQGIKKARKERGCTAKDRISKMPPSTAGKRSSIYRGVTRHRWTGRYEAHLWDKSTWNESQNKKGKQVYLGAYDDEEAAARAYDLAALKYWGSGALINFPEKDYARDLGEMQNVSREDYLASLRRKSSGFSKGMSKYRPFSRWESSPLNSQAQGGLDNITSGFYDAGDEMDTIHEYAVGLSSDRKIDLSNYIKWWSPNGSVQSDVPSKALYDETDLDYYPADAASEIQALERSVQPIEPYEMPRLGFPLETMKHKKVSAVSALMKSAAYIRLKQKISKASEKDESKSKPNIDKLELESSPGQSCQADGSAYEVGELDMQSTASPLASLLSAPFVMIDPISDPGVWSSLMPVLSPGSSSRSNNVIKTESTSDYTFFHPED